MRKLLLLLVVVAFHLMGSSEAYSFSLYRICQSNDTITLNFNPLKDTCSRFVSYQIFWKKGSGQNFKVIDTVTEGTSQKYIHTPDDLNNLEDWQYIIKATADCNPFRVRFSDTLQVDKQRPNVIELDSVSVENGNAVLGWSRSSADDIKGYSIYFVDNGQTRKIDQILGPNNTSYVDQDIGNPSNRAENYRIGAFDSCNNESAVSENAHQSMFLEKPTLDSCAGSFELTWSRYEGWEVGSYAIIAATDTGGTQVAKTVDGNTTSTTVSSLPGGENYDIHIRAIKGGGGKRVTASSNEINVDIGLAADLGAAYLRSASVVDSQVQIQIGLTKRKTFRSIEISRGPNPDDLEVFRTINAVNEDQFTIGDSLSNPQAEPIYYQLKANGLCKDKSVKSNIGRTIKLQKKTIEDSLILRWNAYEVFNAGVNKYIIQKQVRGGDLENWTDLETVNGKQLSFTKLNEIKESDEDRACFRIKAVENPGNEFGFKGSSLSTVVCLLSDPEVFVPNAIVVNGVNNVFKPKGAFVNNKQSTMTIYNRWGEEVFYSDNLNEGWNGKYNGETVAQGVYLYQLTIVGKNQETKTKSGTFRVIR